MLLWDFVSRERPSEVKIMKIEKSTFLWCLGPDK